MACAAGARYDLHACTLWQGGQPPRLLRAIFAAYRLLRSNLESKRTRRNNVQVHPLTCCSSQIPPHAHSRQNPPRHARQPDCRCTASPGRIASSGQCFAMPIRRTDVGHANRAAPGRVDGFIEPDVIYQIGAKHARKFANASPLLQPCGTSPCSLGAVNRNRAVGFSGSPVV
jgi:hypothetical protein